LPHQFCRTSFVANCCDQTTQALPPPVFILGHPRTGTTLLHNRPGPPGALKRP
jgi:hypothetical protein